MLLQQAAAGGDRDGWEVCEARLCLCLCVCLSLCVRVCFCVSVAVAVAVAVSVFVCLFLCLRLCLCLCLRLYLCLCRHRHRYTCYLTDARCDGARGGRARLQFGSLTETTRKGWAGVERAAAPLWTRPRYCARECASHL